MGSRLASASKLEESITGKLDAHVVLDQLAFVLRSVAEDAGDVTALAPAIARRLEQLAERIKIDAVEMEFIASLVKSAR